MLSRKQKAYFKKHLTQRLNESLGKAQHTLADMSDLKDRFSDEIEEASFASNIGFFLRIRAREPNLIRNITDALERLEQGTFGFCEECGEEIPYKRPMANMAGMAIDMAKYYKGLKDSIEVLKTL